MPRIDRLDPRTKLYLSCGLIALLAAALAWWLLAQIGHANALAAAGLRPQPGGPGAAAHALHAHYSHVLLIGWLGVIAVSACAALLGRWLSEEMIRPLREAAEAAARMSAGDLASHAMAGGAGADGQMMRALQAMNDKLAAMVTELRGGAEELAKGAGAVAAHQARLGAQTERQLAGLRQAGAAIGQMRGLLHASAGQAVHAGELALAGHDAAARALALMDELGAAIAAAQGAGPALAGVSRSVDQLAFQAQLLAFGSSADAACAGEQGASRSLLALEARLLAQRAMEAARELRELLAQHGAGLHAGSELAGRARAAGIEAVDAVQRLASQSAALALAHAAHDGAIDGAVQALAGIERSAEESVSMLGQSAGAAAALRDRAGALLRMLGMFRLSRRPLRAGGHMYLAASNPDLIVRTRHERRGRPAIAAVKP